LADITVMIMIIWE